MKVEVRRRPSYQKQRADVFRSKEQEAPKVQEWKGISLMPENWAKLQMVECPEEIWAPLQEKMEERFLADLSRQKEYQDHPERLAKAVWNSIASQHWRALLMYGNAIVERGDMTFEN